MQQQEIFRVLFIGNQSRLIHCAQIVQEKGHHIMGVVSDDPTVKQWAEDSALHFVSMGANWQTAVSTRTFDYLFSIDNLAIVPESIIDQASHLAINFHDAPLPKYAGVHATNWAILNGEATHGVSWHVMAKEIDAGDIVKQALLPIQEDDTALTLNAVCYEKSIETFAELIDDIGAGRVQRTVQDLNGRSYFSRWRRPNTTGYIHWNTTAEKISQLVRALTVGPYQNRLGLAKISVGNKLFIVGQARILTEASAAPAGTILSMEEQSVHVSTQSNDIELTDFCSIEGEVQHSTAFLSAAGLRAGDILPMMSDGERTAVTQIHTQLAKHESFWTEQLTNLRPLILNTAQHATVWTAPITSSSHTQAVPEKFLTFAKSINWERQLLAALTLYLSRISQMAAYSIHYSDNHLSQTIMGYDLFFAPHVPLNIVTQPQQTFEQFSKQLGEQLRLTQKQLTYSHDLWVREPALNGMPVSPSQLPIAIRHLQNKGDLSHHPMAHHLELIVLQDEREIIWRYQPDIFAAETIQKMVARLAVLLAGVAENPTLSMAQLPILTEEELTQLLVEWNQGEVSTTANEPIHRTFEQEVARDPHKTAVIFANDDPDSPIELDEQLTFTQLNQEANQLAHHLRLHQPIPPDTVIGICLERSLYSTTAFWAVLKAGAAFVFLDPHLPQERLHFMLDDAQVKTVITIKQWQNRLPTSCNLVLMDEHAPQIGQAPSNNLDVQPARNDLAYIVYTSGSTGLPKGVMIEHGGLMDRTIWHKAVGLSTREDRLIHSKPLSFDASYIELINSLMMGGSMVIVPQALQRNITATAVIIKKYDLTFFTMIPSMLTHLIEEPALKDCPELRLISSGGEALPIALRDRILKEFDITLLNFYGPSEATIGVIMNECELGSPPDVVPIGRPIAQAKIYITDEHHQLVPIGAPGELLIGGSCVGRGYLNRLELTQQKFIADPFSDDPDAKLYKTGDLVRYLPDGKILFLGRIDNQVKIRGHRIELGEIETLMGQFDGVKTAVVIAREDQPGNKRLVAYIVPDTPQSVDVAQLKESLQQKLPEYMIPTAFVTLDALPFTNTGKIDHRALPQPTASRAVPDTNFVAADGPIEEMVAELWEEILGVSPIGMHDSFFALGGHSLLAVKFVAQLRQEQEIELSIGQLFNYPTIAELAPCIEEILLAELAE